MVFAADSEGKQSRRDQLHKVTHSQQKHKVAGVPVLICLTQIVWYACILIMGCIECNGRVTVVDIFANVAVADVRQTDHTHWILAIVLFFPLADSNLAFAEGSIYHSGWIFSVRPIWFLYAEVIFYIACTLSLIMVLLLLFHVF